jgi:hypothetical protein
MSSQGPSSGSRTVPTGATGCYGPTGTTQVPIGYRFTTTSIRDSSDWTSYKKQSLIFKDPKADKAKDPWFVHGSEYRLEFLNGQYKSACTGCTGTAFTFPTDVTD